MRYLAHLIIIATLTGCLPYEEYKEELIKTEYHTVRVTGFKPPKHVYVSFFDLSNNKHYENAYVSKHCNLWRDNVTLGSLYTVQVDTVLVSDKKGQRVEVKYRNLYGVFCKERNK